MITDRQRFGDGAAGGDALVRRVAAAARAGVHLVQVRERDLDGGPLTRLVEACVVAVRGTAARVLVNDRVDVAIAAGAHGVHLRADSLPAARVRTIIPPGFLIGRSVHALEDIAEAGAVDYLMFGTVFPSASKPERSAAGITALGRAVTATPIPVLAVGGISGDTAAAVAAAGAAGCAAIALFADTSDSGVQAVVKRVNDAFDTPATLT